MTAIFLIFIFFSLFPYSEEAIAGTTVPAAPSLSSVEEEAAKGNPTAQYNLARMYHKGEGVEANSKKASEWYAKASENGNADAQYILGVMYRIGDGVPIDKIKAFHLISQSAEQGFAWAQYVLGEIYQKGEGVAADKKKALLWYNKAADNGNPKALLTLGLIYENRENKKSDVYAEASQQGYVTDQYVLEWVYEKEDGLIDDKNRALEFYRKAAEQGYATAQFYLGWMYYGGIGTEKNEREAFRWWFKAAKLGNLGAEKNINILCQTISWVCKEEIFPETETWNAVKDKRNLEDVERFLKDFPKSKYAESAKELHNELLIQHQAAIHQGKIKAEEIQQQGTQNLDKMTSLHSSNPNVTNVSREENSPNRYFVIDKIPGIVSEFRFISIKSGSFSMGGARYNEGPIHQENIGEDFFIMDTEVSENQYYEYLKSRGTDISPPLNPELPKINVSWNDAVLFSKWLSKVSKHNFRLPTEAEWEYVARKGLIQPSENIIPNNLDKTLLPVRMTTNNNLKIFGMPGNVWEWCNDCWRQRYDSFTDSQACSNRVIRGGSWRDAETMNSVTSRNGVAAETKADNIGFRLVLQD